MANKRFYLIAVLIIAGLSVTLYFSRKKLRYYVIYYAIRMADKYGMIDYEFLSKRYFRNINKNLDLLNEEIYELLDKSGDNVNKDSLVFPPYFDHPATGYEISSDIKRRVYLLAMLVNRLKCQYPIPSSDSETEFSAFSQSILQNRASFKIELPQDMEIINKKFKITNNGDKKMVNPRVVVNNKKKWGDLDSIIKSITKPGMTDEEIALTIWNFLNNNRYHFFPATGEFELHDAVKYLNAYGYGFCDDTATNFYLLATKAGLKARIWGLSGHVVSEAYYQNDWHLLDSDHKVFYLERDNKTLAGVEDLAKNPDLIYRVARADGNFAVKEFIGNGKWTASDEALLYSTTADNQIGKYYMDSVSEKHNLNFTLRPGESFAAGWDGDGRYISYGEFYTLVPPRYGSGQFIYQPMLRDGIFTENLPAKDNLKVIEENGYPALTTADSGKPASFVIDFHTPYPITGAGFEIDCTAKGNDDLLNISFSKDNKQWWEIMKLEGNALQSTNGILAKDFTNYFPNGYDQPWYTYFLKFTLSGKSNSLLIKGLKIITHTQLAPQSLPELENGANAVAYTSESPSAQQVAIEFQYKLGKHYHTVMDMPQLLTPKHNKDGIFFKWAPPKNINNRLPIEYNFQLSARSDFLAPLSPNFDVITQSAGFLVGDQWLNNNQTYYWRVRCRYKDEPWGQSASGNVVL